MADHASSARPTGEVSSNNDVGLEALVSAIAAVAAAREIALDLGADGIPVMVLKGPPVQLRLLGTDTAYCSADVDLLVPGGQGRQARRRLLQLGWKFADDNGLLWRLDRAAAYRQGGTTIDLHWGVHAGTIAARSMRSLEKTLWSGARRCPEGWYEPRSEPLVVYLAVHAGARGFDRPGPLRLLAAAADRADPGEVRAIARALGAEATASYAIALAQGQPVGPAPPLLDGKWRQYWAVVVRHIRTRAISGGRRALRRLLRRCG